MKGIYSSKLLVNENGKIIVHLRFSHRLFGNCITFYRKVHYYYYFFMMSQVIKGEMKKKKKDKNPVKKEKWKRKENRQLILG